MMRLVLVLVLVFASRARAADSRNLLLQGAAQGTTYHIKFVAPPAGVDAEKLRAEITQQLAEIDRQMSTYRDDSEISRFNRAAADRWFAVSPAVVEVVLKSREISAKSDGAQDITVGPLVRLWHFGPGDGTAQGKQAKPQAVGLPSDEEIRRARKLVGYKKLDARLNPPALRKQVDGLDVDLSSIASGYTIDRLSEILEKRGVKDFVAELGGELRAAGKRADGSPWRVAIERPIAQRRELELAVPLVDGALATAGGSRHFFEYAGHRYSHIIDPATGRPVEHALASVTVAADTCIEADGWDTPLVVLGPERGTQCAEQYGIAAMFISHGEQEDVVRTTSAWRKRYPAK